MLVLTIFLTISLCAVVLGIVIYFPKIISQILKTVASSITEVADANSKMRIEELRSILGVDSRQENPYADYNAALQPYTSEQEPKVEYPPWEEEFQTEDDGWIRAKSAGEHKQN